MKKESDNKRVLLIALLAIFIIGPVAGLLIWANSGDVHVEVRHDNPSVSRSAGMADKIAEEVGLDSKQRLALAENMAKVEIDMKAIQGDKSLSRDQKLSKLQDLMDKANRSNTALMTPEQAEKYRAMLSSGAMHN